MATGTIILPINGVKFPTTNPVALDASETNWRLLFDATTDEAGWWQFRMPQNYASTPVLKLQYSMLSATTGAVYFQVQVMAVSDNDAADINTESYDTANSGNATVPGTVGFLDEISITLITMIHWQLEIMQKSNLIGMRIMPVIRQLAMPKW